MKDLILRSNTKDTESYNQIYVHEQYSCLKDIENVRTIVDLGAYIGLSALYLSELYPDAQVLALEADPQNFEIGKENIAKHNNGNIWFGNEAVWTHPQMVSLKRCERTWATRVDPKSSDEMVSTLTMRQILSMTNRGEIDILKIDIEGTEKHIFKSDYEYWIDRTRNIAIELHDRADSDVFFEAMRGYNYIFSTFQELTVCKNIERR